MRRLVILLALVVSMVMVFGIAVSEEVCGQEFERVTVKKSDSGRYTDTFLMGEALRQKLGYIPNYSFYEADRCLEIYLLNVKVEVQGVFYDSHSDTILVPEFNLPDEVIEQNEIISEFPEGRYYLAELDSEEFTVKVISERRNGTLSLQITSHLPDEDGKSFYVIVYSADYEEDCDDYRIPKKEYMQLYYDVYGI